ncbi:MAG: AsmA family protein [Bacteroidales bacterium]|nr:AsmA family protein [Bacteroidales bacterium]
MKVVKVLRKTLKIFLIALASLVLLIIILLTIAKLSENRISRLVLNEVSEMIDAPVTVDNVSLLLLRKFPYATVEFHGFKMGVNKSGTINSLNIFENDTLISIRELFVSIKSKPLLKSKIEIEKIEIEGFTFNYNVDSTGVSNIDFLLATDTTQIDDEDTSATVLDILLSNLTVRDVTVNYNDEQLKAKAKLHIPEMDITGRVLNEYYAGSIKGKALATNISFDDTNVYLMDKISIDFSLAYDDGKVDVESVYLQTDGATLTAKGEAILADSIFVYMTLALSEVNLKELSKYATNEMLNEFGLVSIDGQMQLDAKITGYVYDTLVMPQVQASMSLKRGTIKTTDYPEIKHISFNGNINALDPNNFATISAQFNDFRVATNKSHIDLSFTASNLDKPTYNVKTSGHVNFDEFSSLIPDSTVEYLTGSMAFNLSTSGTLPDNLGMENADYFLERTRLEVKVSNLSTALDSIDEVKNLNFNFAYLPSKQISISNLSLEAPGYGVALQNSSLSGKILGFVRDMDNMGVDLDSYFIQMGNNTIEGKTYVKGLENVTFKTDTKANIDFDELRPFIPDSLVENISGKAMVSLKSYGKVHLDSIEDKIMHIAFEQSSISAQMRDFSFEMFDDTLVKVNNLSLDFAMANDTMRIDNLYGNAHGIEFWMDSTEIWNVYKAFLLEQKDLKVIVNTHIRASDIDYAQFAPLLETDSTQVSIPEEEPMYIPQYIARGTLSANSVKYDNMVLSDISAKFRVDDSLYIADDIKFNAFGGNMVTSVLYDMRYAGKEKVEFKNTINGMDIRQLLIDANDFGQTYFTHENIEGILTSSVNGRLFVTGDSIHYDKITMLGNFKLENGGIYEFEPAMELSKFTNLRELDRIVFRTMVSSIFIYDNKVFFPKTDIVSSAIDMAAYGMQSFGKDYEYHLNVHLSDVLLGKSQKLLKKQGMESDIFEGEDKSKRSGLFLVSYDKEGETKNGFDTKSLQRYMKTVIRVHERGLNLIFNPLLQNYSTDIDRKEGKRD